MKLAAVMTVKNEASILSANIGYHRSLGVDDFRIIDNGSIDQTTNILEYEQRVHGDVQWRSEAGEFAQSAMTTAPAAEAIKAGADWVLPIDADEFWWTKDGSFRRKLEEADGVGAMVCGVDNFVQRRSVIEDQPSSLATMTYSVIPNGTIETAQELVESGAIGFVEMVYPPKQILRASSELVIRMGNHSATNLAGSKLPVSTIRVLHAPIRARSKLRQRAKLGERAANQYPNSSTSWHLKRWARLATEDSLEEDWKANSQRFGRLRVGGSFHQLRRDLRLRNAVVPFLERSVDC